MHLHCHLQILSIMTSGQVHLHYHLQINSFSLDKCIYIVICKFFQFGQVSLLILWSCMEFKPNSTYFMKSDPNSLPSKILNLTKLESICGWQNAEFSLFPIVFSTAFFHRALGGSVVEWLTRNPGILCFFFFLGNVFGQDTLEHQPSTGETQERQE